MITIEEILARRKAERVHRTDDELRRLPDREAIVYGRVSDPHQIRDSREAIRDIAMMVDMAKQDGYKTGLTSTKIEVWLEDIRNGVQPPGVINDGEVTVECRDLGLSGQLGEDRRLGLANVKHRLEGETLGAIYTPEISRLSRDEYMLEPYEILKLAKNTNCKFRTPQGVLSPQVERDLEYIEGEFLAARRETKTMNRRLGLRRRAKAERGEYAGEPVPPGFYLPIVDRKSSGKYVFGKYRDYEPHAEVVRLILKEFVRQQGSYLRIARKLRNVTFPCFPSELEHMKTRSALRSCAQNDSGYVITPALVKGAASNLALIGCRQWVDTIVKDNHPPVVGRDLFLQAYALVIAKSKPRGRAIQREPLPFAGILQCCDHDVPQRVSAKGSSSEYRCEKEYQKGFADSSCFCVDSRYIDGPLVEVILRQLDFTSFARQVVATLEMDIRHETARDSLRHKEISRFEETLRNIEANLGKEPPDSPLEEAYKRRWLNTKEKLEELKAQETSPTHAPNKVDIEVVRDFLANLPRRWRGYRNSLKNRFLKLLIDRIELRRDGKEIRCRIVWKTGLEQSISIQRGRATGSREARWTEAEERMLRSLWASSSKAQLLADLPHRTWEAIRVRAHRLGLKPHKQSGRGGSYRRWTVEEINRARQQYLSGEQVEGIATSLGRTPESIHTRARKQSWEKPSAATFKRPKESCPPM